MRYVIERIVDVEKESIDQDNVYQIRDHVSIFTSAESAFCSAAPANLAFGRSNFDTSPIYSL